LESLFTMTEPDALRELAIAPTEMLISILKKSNSTKAPSSLLLLVHALVDGAAVGLTILRVGVVLMSCLLAHGTCSSSGA
jgi:hypothetical protein